MKQTLYSLRGLLLIYSLPLLVSSCTKTGGDSVGAAAPSMSRAGISYRVTTLADHLHAPQALAVDPQGNLFFTQAGGSAVEEISLSGQLLPLEPSVGAAQVAGLPWGIAEGIAIDLSGYLYVVDAGNALIRKISSSGQAAASISVSSFQSSPFGISLDRSGNLFVTDPPSGSVWRIHAGGGASAVLNSTSNRSAISLGNPQGIASDGQGNFYLTDITSSSVFKLDQAGDLTRIAGGNGNGYLDGPGTSARFNRPSGIALDAMGNLFVADAGNAAIRRITPDGQVSTIAGGKTVGFADGVGQEAQFDSPEGIAIDAQGTIYIADACYGAIRKISLQ